MRCPRLRLLVHHLTSLPLTSNRYHLILYCRKEGFWRLAQVAKHRKSVGSWSPIQICPTPPPSEGAVGGGPGGSADLAYQRLTYPKAFAVVLVLASPSSRVHQLSKTLLPFCTTCAPGFSRKRLQVLRRSVRWH